MKFFNELVDEIKLIETPSLMFLVNQSYMIIGVGLIFVSYFEIVDFLFNNIANILSIRRFFKS